MFVPTGLLISCLALLSVSLGASIQNVDSTEPIARHCRKVPPGRIVIVGEGIEPSYLPYYLSYLHPWYEVDDHDEELSYEIFSSRGDHCTVNLPIGSNHAQAPFTLFQGSASTTYLYENHGRYFYSLNMSTCKSQDLLEKIRDKNNVEFETRKANMIHYEDGFDEIFAENNTVYRVSYDVEGNQIVQPKPFLLDSPINYLYKLYHTTYKLLPTSTKSRSGNLIFETYEQAKKKVDLDKVSVDLVDADGRLVKHLLAFTHKFNEQHPVVYNISDSAYAFCRFAENGFECLQFDRLGNEIYRNSTHYKPDDKTWQMLLSVRNLKDGPGVVLFTATFELPTNPKAQDVREEFVNLPIVTRVNTFEMRPGKITKKSYSVAKKQYDPIIAVTDFDGTKFTIRQGFLSTPDICWTTYSLATKQE